MRIGDGRARSCLSDSDDPKEQRDIEGMRAYYDARQRDLEQELKRRAAVERGFARTLAIGVPSAIAAVAITSWFDSRSPAASVVFLIGLGFNLVVWLLLLYYPRHD
ncbi:hypothetical protein Lfu02_41100 [Longispora fulva]|uniref:Uncharacterized protein n=1 Tax=Longispora fulva TaxID=619741 RepID=A0A8J7GDD4_9ACTN|nr:hypothetical protein [Longispora fulva]MBG6136569.1 hypothetical protein [Longispora fulva]GIG59738.1 hypothetical protein Lfu02_41100 [Longispora fulva]